jgi:hypothetical protein
MTKSLYVLFKKAKEGDENAKVELYFKFLPCIKSFAKKLHYEESETDLTIFFLEFINKINLKKFYKRKNEEIDSYVNRAIKNKYINIVRENINKKIITTPLEDVILETYLFNYDYYEKLENEYIFALMQNSNNIQKKIIIGKYIYDYSDVELTIILDVSRQTIYNNKKKALILIEKEFKKGA